MPVTEEYIISASTSKRVHGIFDLYPTKDKMLILQYSHVLIKKVNLPYLLIFPSNTRSVHLTGSRRVVQYINAVQCSAAQRSTRSVQCLDSLSHIIGYRQLNILLAQKMTSESWYSENYSEIDVTPYPFFFHGEIIISHMTSSRPILVRQI